MSDEGASPRELLLEACRRNNTELLSEVIKSQSSAERTAQLLNTATDGVGNYCLHIAASYGSYEVLDTLLDQEGLEVDPLDRLEADSPLHKAVRFVNGLPKPDWEAGGSLIELLLDAGADPRIRNKAKLKPMELVDPRNTELRGVLQKGEFAMMAGDDVVDGDGGEEDGATGSASDSE
ncbi:MAG: ankyrin repeat protein [Lasallia pustulata]|uniref:Ankyrin repeat protein n=1 Tax=Lasallia pustulata TaxID=136370 RepID=A0A1W5DDU7_9LECA|nr:MAG: ankyrin repeat protein [Lasallia pustulata]SLM41029.1 Ankyrin repeat-containing domain [Lasallia pustulata]